jgi:hypothetical protein
MPSGKRVASSSRRELMVARKVKDHASGHPLFLTTIVDELMRLRILESADTHAISKVIPTSVRQFIEHRSPPRVFNKFNLL